MRLISKKSQKIIKRKIKNFSKKLAIVKKTVRSKKRTILKNIKATNKQINKSIKSYNKQHSDTERKNAVSVVVLAILIIGLCINLWSNNRSMKINGYSTTLDQTTAFESRILIAGDVYWGRDINKWSQNSPRKEAYPFRHLSEFDKSSYDAWVANLECPSVPGIKVSLKDEKENLIFNCPTSYLTEAAKWFNVFSLANNHTSNQNKEKGLTATRKALEKSGIQYFGHFNPNISTDACEIVAMPARVRLNNAQQSVNVPVAMCGFAGVNYKLQEKDLEPIKMYSKYMPVIVMPHMGTEYRAGVDSERQTLYRKMIDYGADMVIGNHPHWVQPSEAYKGKLIVYSMGNFIFDQQFSSEVTRSAAISLIISIKQGSVSENQLKTWVNIGSECAVFQDKCLDKIKLTSTEERMPFKFNFNIVGVQTSGKTTKPSNARTYNSILDRLNWKQTQNELSANNSTEN